MNLKPIVLTLLVGAAGAASALPPTKVRSAEPSVGMSSDDLILYTVDATELGADKLGSRDSTEAIQQALDRCNEAQGGTVFLPAGRYRVNGTLTIKPGTSLRGEWVNPEKGGLGKGTILMAYAGRGEANPDARPFISLSGASCVRDLSIWYPSQSPTAPVPYPATIRGHGHAVVQNVTLYNSWTGYWNNGCSSMLIRRLYGTPLKLGIHGGYAFDIPRIEHVKFAPRYWAESGLPGAPSSGAPLTKLKAFLAKNLVAIQAAEQDWGYWWDLDIDTCQKGLYLTVVPDDRGEKLVPGNICAGNVKIRNASVGVFVENAGYPGFMLTYGDITARVCPLYFADRTEHPAYTAMGLKMAYQKGSSLMVTGVRFHGGKYSVASAKIGQYGLNLSGCTFDGYTRGAVRAAAGSVTVTNCRFLEKLETPLEMTDDVDQVVLLGNEFKGGAGVKDWVGNDPRIFRDDNDKSVPPVIKYAFDYVSHRRPVGRRIWDVTEFGAVAGTRDAPPADDSSEAIQRALDKAGSVKDGGTVYVPAGVYRLDKPLRVPTGVELRGSFEGQHYGNGCDRGTQLWIYGGLDRPDDPPAVTLARGSGFKGFTVYYPVQGWTDNPNASAWAKVRQYPPTLRTASDCWVQNNTIVCCWRAIDAMTVKSDNLEISDVTGASLYSTLEYGHGATGGIVRDLHFNYSNWTHQGRFPNRPRHEESEGKLPEYTGRVVKGLVLGDLSKTTFFSCFNIIVAEQIVLEKDRYTGGSFHGKMWGVAFDAAHNGVVGRAGSEAVIALIASMGVFNQQGGGFYAETDPAFKGRIVFSNADVWSWHSRIANVSGGTVTFSQLLSWCCLEAVCHKGGTLNVHASTYVGDHIPLNVQKDCIRYEAGAKGAVSGTVECRKILSLVIDPSASVKQGLNGVRK